MTYLIFDFLDLSQRNAKTGLTEEQKIRKSLVLIQLDSVEHFYFCLCYSKQLFFTGLGERKFCWEGQDSHLASWAQSYKFLWIRLSKWNPNWKQPLLQLPELLFQSAPPPWLGQNTAKLFVLAYKMNKWACQ